MPTSQNFEDVLPIVLTGTVTALSFAVHQGRPGIYMKGGDSGAVVPFKVKGRINGVKKKSGATWTAGQKLYWDATTELQFQTTATGMTDYGVYAAAAAGSSDTTGDIIIW